MKRHSVSKVLDHSGNREGCLCCLCHGASGHIEHYHQMMLDHHVIADTHHTADFQKPINISPLFPSRRLAELLPSNAF